MRRIRFFAIPVVMIFVLACGLSNGIQQAATQLPGLLTSAPTALGAMETVAAGQPAVGSIETAVSGQPSSNCASTTPASGGLGISMDTVKAVLQVTGQFDLTDGSVNGQPASTVALTQSAAAAFPSVANGFSAQFIGDPCDIGKVIVTIPRSDQQATSDQGMGLITTLLAGVMPAGTQLPIITWLTQEYDSLPVGGQQQNTFGNMQLTLQRTQTQMILEILSVQ